jgi:uncharacterized protein
MQCFVYASTRKPDSYLWLAQRDEFAGLPAALAAMLGSLHFVMEVQLDPQRKLPVEDTEQVLEHLRTHGWHLQLPPPETLAAANHPVYGKTRHDERKE